MMFFYFEYVKKMICEWCARTENTVITRGELYGLLAHQDNNKEEKQKRGWFVKRAARNHCRIDCGGGVTDKKSIYRHFLLLTQL
jgi:hypothetical protein